MRTSLFVVFRMVTQTDRRIPDLYQVIAENAPNAIKAGEIKNHFGRKVAIVGVTLAALLFYPPSLG